MNPEVKKRELALKQRSFALEQAAFWFLDATAQLHVAVRTKQADDSIKTHIVNVRKSLEHLELLGGWK